MMREIQLTRVARHQRVEVGHFAPTLGPEDATQPLRFFLPRAKRAGRSVLELQLQRILHDPWIHC